MKDIIIRKVKPTDAEQHIKLNNLVWRDAYKHIFPEEVFDQRDKNANDKIKLFPTYAYNDNKQLMYVAEDDGKIVGLITAQLNASYPYFEQKGYADLMALYIDPNYQGQGIGSKLKKVFTDWAKQNGATKYIIGVLKDNHKARLVYEKWGGKLDEYSQPFTQLGVEYEEVFYTFNL